MHMYASIHVGTSITRTFLTYSEFWFKKKILYKDLLKKIWSVFLHYATIWKHCLAFIEIVLIIQCSITKLITLQIQLFNAYKAYRESLKKDIVRTSPLELNVQLPLKVKNCVWWCMFMCIDWMMIKT